jgi:peptidyl-prolyl cis-trans isomerase SurA
MKRLPIFVFVTLLATASSVAQAVDRVVAVVNKHVITQSDWEDQSNFEALVEGRSVDAKPSSAALERLIERALISDAITSAYLPQLDSAQVDAQLQEIRKQSNAADDAAWKKVLATYSLSEPDVREKLAEQLSTAQLFEMRFRSTIRVNDEEVKDYYQKSFLPEMLNAGAKESSVPKLEEVSARIQRILTEQKLTEAVVTWMETLRSQAKIKQLVTDAR